MPDEEQQKNFADYGYYSAPLVDAKGNQVGNKKTKVISMNNNICYTMNWDSAVQFWDPGNMLQWLDKELNDLEKVNGTAIILSHVPNQSECNRQYGRRLHAILDRYQTVIRWGMYAHVHQEQYQIQRDMIESKPIGMNFIVSSGTTYQGKPPSFNVIYVDPETMLPVDYESWVFDLDHANAHDEPKWDRVHDYRDTYQLKDLSPASFWEHSQKIFREEKVAMQYRNNRYLGGPGQNPTDPCGFECRTSYYCQTVADDYDEYQYCLDKDKADFSADGIIMTIQDFIDHFWFNQTK